MKKQGVFNVKLMTPCFFCLAIHHIELRHHVSARCRSPQSFLNSQLGFYLRLNPLFFNVHVQFLRLSFACADASQRENAIHMQIFNIDQYLASKLSKSADFSK